MLASVDAGIGLVKFIMQRCKMMQLTTTRPQKCRFIGICRIIGTSGFGTV
jgi:hypothetical protein